MNKNVIKRRNVEYKPLIESFKKEIKGLNIKGLNGPHFPSIGECYENSKYKFVFCGMETYGWFTMEDLMKDDENYLLETDKCLDRYNPLSWCDNLHATFWAFVFKFLAKFYNFGVDKLMGNEINDDVQAILKSFVWSNTNSIERFEVASKCKGGSPEVWQKVKQASRHFDNLTHIINSCAPNVVFILYSGASEDYFLSNENLSEIYGVDFSCKNNVLLQRNEKFNYDYYYLRSTNTHVFKLPHPRYMGQFSGIGIDKYVEALYKDIKNYQIWDALPTSPRDRLAPISEIINKSSSEYKYQLVAKLARTLTQNNIVMSGKELQDLFNMNGITTTYGTPYGDNGGQGIHRLLSCAWHHYQDVEDFQTAYDISRAFVNQNGEYAYE